jgi:hypothetical protein
MTITVNDLMRKSMKQLLLAVSLLCAAVGVIAQDHSVTETTIRVYGNCGQCKTRIEKGLAIKEVTYAKWDKRTKLLSLAYDSSAITLDSLEQRIAFVGHDTDRFTAPDSVYSRLPACCLFRDGENTH